MDGNLEVSHDPSVNESRRIVELFDELCPYYLSIGMSYSDYWDGDPAMTKFYHKAESLRRRKENYLAWLQGAYVYEAVSDLAPALKAFAKGSPKPYRTEVIPLLPEEIEEYQKRKEREEYERNLEQLKRWADDVNRDMRKKKEADTNGS